MNYCPNCGIPVEPDWNVCANCGHVLSREQISTMSQKEPETQLKIVESVKPKPSLGYFEPQKTYGILAFSFGIMGISASFMIMVLRSIGYSNIMILFNILIILSGIIAVIFGIIGIVKDDSKALAIFGLIFGVASFVLMLIRYYLYLFFSIIPIID